MLSVAFYLLLCWMSLSWVLWRPLRVTWCSVIMATSASLQNLNLKLDQLQNRTCKWTFKRQEFSHESITLTVCVFALICTDGFYNFLMQKQRLQKYRLKVGALFVLRTKKLSKKTVGNWYSCRAKDFSHEWDKGVLNWVKTDCLSS